MSKHIGAKGLPQNVRSKLTESRRSKGLSQLELGRLVGLPQMHISAIETGKVVPRFDTLLELVRVLGHDLVLVPRNLVPVVRALCDEPSAKGDEDRPLYTPDEDDVEAGYS